MNTVESLISIIIPVYNRADVIEECVASVLAQTYQNFEIVIVDDGSTDNTFGICKDLANNEPRIKLFEAAHGGVSAARNLALEKATGDYVFFLDSDDVIHPYLLETLLNGMTAHNAAIGATDVTRARAESWHRVHNIIAKANHPGDVDVLTAEEIVDAALDGHSPLACIGGVMMRTSLIGNTRFHQDIYIGEDFYFIYENIIKGTAGVFLKQKWYYVRLHDANSSWDYSYNGFLTRFYRRKLVWENEEKLGRQKYADKQKNSILHCYSICADKNSPYSRDCKRMRKILKEYKKVILPCLSMKGKLAYLLSVYLPATSRMLFKLKKARSSK